MNKNTKEEVNLLISVASNLKFLVNMIKESTYMA